MIEPTWRRIGGFHAEDDGTIGVVWLAHDTVTSVVHCYDVAVFKNELMLVMQDAIAARGRHFPMAWAKKDEAFAKKFLDAGISILHDPCGDTPAMIDVNSRAIMLMLKASRFRVDKRVGEWLREYKDFFRQGSKVPQKGFPLMAATRHAIEMIEHAQQESLGTTPAKNYPELALI